VASLKPGPDGQWRRKKVSGRNKSEVRAKLAELHDELNDGVVTNAAYTVAQAINDWLADGLIGAARLHGLYAYIVLSLLIGVRTEEARALRWDHVDLEATQTPSRRCLPMSTCGARYVPTGTPRRGSPGVRWDCRGWRWKCSGSTCSGRRTRGYGRAFCGRTTGSSSRQRTGHSSMRRTCAGLSGPFAGERASTRSGRRANYGTPLSLC